MRYFFRLLIACICALAGGLLHAEARRVALVIGNADYKIGRLANPGNDATAVAAALEGQLKFDAVLLRKNLSLDGFRAALREMAHESRGAELGLIYFAGHGIEVGGRNYLIPVDAALAAAHDVELETIALDTVLAQLGGVTRLRLVILDACRNNPFSLDGAKRSVTRGLARIEPEGGTLVAYAAKDGTTADDGQGKHSPFTAALLKRIVSPGLDVRRLFGYVSEDVKAATNHVQVPYLYGQLGGEEVHLVPAAAAPPAPPAPAAAPSPPAVAALPQPGAAAETARVCREVEGMSNPATLAVLERQYKGTPAGECAEARLKQLAAMTLPKVLQPAVVAPPKAPSPVVAPDTALTPGRIFRDCPECPEMVVVPAGSFMMGSSPSEIDSMEREYSNTFDYEGPQHRVTIARPFAVARFEATFAEWDACVTTHGCAHYPRDSGWGRGKRPVMDVSWDDITRQYLPWLNRKTGKTYRLPTEAEWEYAARAGTTGRYSFGNSIGPGQAQFKAGTTAEVGSFQPNAFGLYDVHGNVFEWVQDCWNDGYTGAPSDGSAWMAGKCASRVLRGGSLSSGPNVLRSATRRAHPLYFREYRLDKLGFRVARTL